MFTKVSLHYPQDVILGGENLMRPLHFSGTPIFRNSLRLLPLCLTFLANAATFTVTTNTDSGPGSLRDAVANAALAVGADVIVFSASQNGGTINLTNEIVVNDASGITVDATSLPEGITLDASLGTSRIFSNATGSKLTLVRLGLTGGGGAGALESGSGGAVLSAGLLTVRDCTFHGNSAVDGGALSSKSNNGITASATLTNCTFAGNSAGSAGAIRSSSAALTLTHCTISANTASSGVGGISLEGGTASMRNTIMAANTGTPPDLGGSATALTLAGRVFVGDNTGNYMGSLPAGAPSASGDYIGTSGSPLDPQLAPLGNNGGFVKTMPPLSGSLVVDHASLNGIAFVPQDARGNHRKLDGDADNNYLADLGAVEFIPSDYTLVRNTSTSGLGSLSNANVNSGQLGGKRTITFDAALNGATILQNARLWLFGPIDASNLPNGVTIAAQGTTRLFETTSTSVTVRNLTLANASAGFYCGAGSGALSLFDCRFTGNGYGVHNDGGSVSANRCMFSANTNAVYNVSGTVALSGCTLSDSIEGAILQDTGGLLNLSNCTLTNNHSPYLATAGGGIRSSGTVNAIDCTFSANGGAILAAGTLNIARSVFRNNGASEGGALDLISGNAVFENCTFTQNSGGNIGTIQQRAGALTLRHCTVSGNSASYENGGIGVYGGTLTIANSIISGNTGPASTDIVNSATIVLTGANIVGVLTNNAGGSDSGPAPIASAPLLAPLGDYGGPSKSMALLPGSPARDAAVGSTQTTDQRGYPIVGTPDIGAYEAGTFSDFDAWAWESLPASASQAEHLVSADGDGDGASLLLEYALLTSPLLPEARTAPGFTIHDGLGNIVIPFRRNAQDLTYTIERSSTLGTWTPIVILSGATNDYTAVAGITFIGSDAASFTFADNLTGKTRCFYRLKVVQQN